MEKLEVRGLQVGAMARTSPVSVECQVMYFLGNVNGYEYQRTGLNTKISFENINF